MSEIDGVETWSSGTTDLAGTTETTTTTTSSNPYLVNGSARDTQAKLYREQFDDYIARFAPKEEELIASYNNRAGITQQKTAEAMDFAQQGIGNAQQAQGLVQSRYQYAMTPQEQEAQARQFDLSSGLAQVDAANRTRQHIADRYRNMLSGGLSTFTKREVQ